MKTEVFDFGTLKIGQNYIIGEIKEGVDVQMDVVHQIMQVAKQKFKNGQWGYISNRINSYSVQPTVHIEIPKFEQNMVAFAVVVSDKNTGRFIELEQRLAKEHYQFASFRDMDTAIQWVESLIPADSH